MLKYKVNFYLNKESRTTPGDYSIIVYVSYAGQRPHIYTSIYVTKEDWSKELQRSKNKKSYQNSELNEIENIIDDIFKDYDYTERRYPSPKELKNNFDNRYKRKLPKDFEDKFLVQDIYEEYISTVSVRDSWTLGNIKKHNKIRNHFKFYNSNLDLARLTESDLIGAIKYFQTEPKILLKNGKIKEQPPHKNITVDKNIKDFKAFLRWAHKCKYYNGDLHDSFRPKFKGISTQLNEIIYFPIDKLIKFYNHKFSKDEVHLEQVRDVIAFCCFSSLRFSDVAKLKKAHVAVESFSTVTAKTVDKLNIHLNEYSRSILNKYANIDLPNGLALPVISQQNTNEHLKTIGQILNFNNLVSTVYFIGNKRFEDIDPFWAHMSTHIGRRTFVVVAIYLGIPETVIMKYTGHKDYETMKPYIAVMENQKKSEMLKFDTLNIDL
ncbi:hypothetical protein [Soonwooa purpurea]